LVLYTNLEDGYELLLPRSWVQTTTGPDGQYFEPPGLWGAVAEQGSTPYPGVRRFGVGAGNSLRPALTVSIGEPDGSVYGCYTPTSHCEEVIFQSPEEITDALRASDTAACTRHDHSDVSLDGSPALVRSPRGPGNNCSYPEISPSYVYTIRKGTPVILGFDSGSASRRNIDEMIESFRFLDQPGSISGDDLVLYSNEEDGYELLLPESWVAGATGPNGSYTEPSTLTESYEGVRRFGHAFSTESLPALTISIGEPDGSVTYCLGYYSLTCERASLDDIEEIKELLVTSQEVKCAGVNGLHGSVIQWETTLGGEPAGAMRLDSVHDVCRVSRGSGSMMFGGIRGSHHIVYTIHDGEPVILAFDRMTVETFAGIRRELPAILESFRFLERSS
jgi:hypothetical protein